LGQATPSALDPALDDLDLLDARPRDRPETQQRLIGRDQDRAEKDVLHPEGEVLVDLIDAITTLDQPIDDPQEAIVVGLRRTLGWISDVAEIRPLIRRQALGINLDRTHGSGPARRVVHAALPRMDNGDEAGSLRIPRRMEISMPLEERPERLGGISNLPLVLHRGDGAVHGYGMDRGRHDPAGADPRRGSGGGLAGPARRPREVLAVRDAGIEADVRQHPVPPLPPERRAHLLDRALRIHMDKPGRDEGAVPAPLVRVEPRRGPGP